MSTLTHGMDVGQVRGLASTIHQQAEAFTSAQTAITSALGRTDWRGRDADVFRSQWRGSLKPKLIRASEAATEFSDVLRRNADEQERASGLGNFGMGGDPSPSIWGDLWGNVDDGCEWLGDRVEDGVRWGGDVIGDAWDTFTEHVSAGWTGFTRVADATESVMSGLRGELISGSIPEPAQIVAGFAVISASQMGAVANFLGGEDYHFFDDGRPRMGTPQVSGYGGGPESLTDVLSGVQGAYDSGGLIVTATVGTDGVTRFITTVPGTQADIASMDGWTGKENGRDWAANLWGVGTGTSSATEAAQQATVGAIAAYQQSHPDAVIGDTPEVLLVGHSQGGIIAANMASDADFTAQVTVSGIANMAGPIDTADVPSDIPVVSMQNGNSEQFGDLVPRTDLGGWPGTPDHITTVQFDAKGPAWDVGANHEVQAYLSSVSSPEGQAALEAWVAANPDVANFYSGDPSQAVTYDVDFGRTTD